MERLTPAAPANSRTLTPFKPFAANNGIAAVIIFSRQSLSATHDLLVHTASTIIQTFDLKQVYSQCHILRTKNLRMLHGCRGPLGTAQFSLLHRSISFQIETAFQ